MVKYWGEQKNYRNINSIKTPSFDAPVEHRRFMRGNTECNCICSTKHLPRNAILIRAKNKKLQTDKLYDILINAWKKGAFDFIKIGTCQQFIRSNEIKSILKPVKNHFIISCVDNVDNRILLPGDILLSRIGTGRSVGKPHLIKSSVMWED